MRLLLWLTVLAWSALHSAALASVSPQDWRVTNVVRTIELGGTVTVLSDIHVIRAPAGTEEPSSNDDPAKPYYFAFSQADAGKISILEATVKFGAGVTPAQRGVLPVKDEGILDEYSHASLSQNLEGGNQSSTASRPHLFSVQIPAAYLRRAHQEEQVPDITVYLHALLLHTSEPLPLSVAQTESQFLLWSGDAAPVAIYDVEIAKIKVKSSHPRILSYTTTPSLPADQMTKSGTTITFGPFENLKSFLAGQGSSSVPKAQVHYLHDAPVVSLVEANRVVTVSHWHNTLSVEDELWLRNDGAALKGHFSRIDHQMSAFYKKDNSHILSNLVMHLPPGTRDAYFVDQAGNVSTSNFRPSPPSPKHITTSPHLLSGNKASVLDVKPRYPILGGWNYTFSVGWNVKLSDGWQSSSGSRYTLSVPFMTPITDVAIDSASTTIILPEGARNIQVTPPFAVDEQTFGSKWYFSDTTGSPIIEMRKKHCSERHGGLIIINYTLSPLDHFRKVFVGVALIVIAYISVVVASKIDLRIKG
ncbi:hypothetical protein CBS101457_005343 [Exobasidium rhododendri]|nr:hypothetical protein CBS101457_005343 [Exobasidium rhododendri]